MLMPISSQHGMTSDQQFWTPDSASMQGYPLATHNFLDEAEFVRNPDPRALFLLLVDTSTTMRDSGAIHELNEGLRAFHEDVMEDPLARRRLEICIVSFGLNGVQVIQDWVSAAQFQPPTLQAHGVTPMGKGCHVGLDRIESRKATFRGKVQYYRPTAVLICDGDPTDEWQSAADRIHSEEEGNKVAWFSIGVEGADMNMLARLSHRSPRKLKGMSFRELFLWLSNSQKRVSNSRVGDKVSLPPVSDWAVM